MPKKSDVNFSPTAKDYAKHRAGFPPSFFEHLSATGVLKDRKTALDVGTGTGTVARGLAKMGMQVFGLDPSTELMAQAQELDQAAGVSIKYVHGRAESTTLESSAFDCITAGQCWHWFDQDLVLPELRRILRPGGILIVAYFDWIRLPGNPVDEMFALQAKYNPSWESSWPLGFYPWQPNDLKLDGFKSIASFNYEEDVTYTQEAWRGRMRAYAGIGGSLPATTVAEFDQEFASVLKEKFPATMQIPHKIWAEVWT